jgi:hypothetical protein
MERDLDDEVRLHFEQQVEKFVRQGMARQEAVRQARLLFGCIDEVKEECRDARGGRRRFRPGRRLVRRTRPGLLGPNESAHRLLRASVAEQRAQNSLGFSP